MDPRTRDQTPTAGWHADGRSSADALRESLAGEPARLRQDAQRALDRAVELRRAGDERAGISADACRDVLWAYRDAVTASLAAVNAERDAVESQARADRAAAAQRTRWRRPAVALASVLLVLIAGAGVVLVSTSPDAGGGGSMKAAGDADVVRQGSEDTRDAGGRHASPARARPSAQAGQNGRLRFTLDDLRQYLAGSATVGRGAAGDHGREYPAGGRDRSPEPLPGPDGLRERAPGTAPAGVPPLEPDLGPPGSRARDASPRDPGGIVEEVPAEEPGGGATFDRQGSPEGEDRAGDGAEEDDRDDEGHPLEPLGDELDEATDEDVTDP